MSYIRIHSDKRASSARKLAGLGLCVAAAFAVAVTPAMAQKKDAGKAAAAEKKSSWVKICDQLKVKTLPKGKDGKPDKKAKPVEKEVKYCVTQHEAVTPAGAVLYAAGIREFEGDPKKVFMLTVAHPPGAAGIAVSQGMTLTVDGTKDVHKFNFTRCNPANCIAEFLIKDELIKTLKSAKAMAFRAFTGQGRPFGTPIDLTGLKSAMEGKPLEFKTYVAAKRKHFEARAAREKAAIESDPKLKDAVNALAKARKDLAGVVKEKQKDAKAAAGKSAEPKKK